MFSLRSAIPSTRILQHRLFACLTHSYTEKLTLRPQCRGLTASWISKDAKRSWAVARLGCQGVLGVAIVSWVSAVWPVCMSAACRTRVLWSSQTTTQDKHTRTHTHTHTHYNFPLSTCFSSVYPTDFDKPTTLTDFCLFIYPTHYYLIYLHGYLFTAWTKTETTHSCSRNT